MTIAQDLKKAEVLSPYVEMIIFDGRSIDISLYFHFTNSSDTPFSRGGIEYTPFPYQISGAERTTGQPPRPKLTVANANKLLQPYLQQYQDLKNVKVTRIQTLAKFLDGQPTADPDQELPREIYFIDTMLRMDRSSVEFELVNALDVSIKLPRAQALKDDLTIIDDVTEDVIWQSHNMWAPGLSSVRFRG